MGFLAECREAGIPELLLIPIRPWDKPDEDGKNAGKAPACPNDYGSWFGLKDWQNADMPWKPIKDLADQCGANAGLVLGTMVDGWAFAAIDFDLDAGQTIHRDRLLNSYALAHKGEETPKDVLVRETVPYRAMVLLRLGSMTDTGSKAVYHISHGTEKIGKIELLTVHQQTVIAGIHHSKNPIAWEVFGDPDNRRSTPQISDQMLTFDTFIQAAEDFRQWLHTLVKLGYKFDYEASKRGEGHEDNRDLAPEWLTLDKLIEVVAHTPNKATTTRDEYVDFMHAIAASLWGIIAWHGEPSSSDRNLLDHCVAGWAAEWPGNKNDPDAFGSEMHKWLTDWSKKKQFATSWYRLVGLASQFGNREAAAINAQYDFIGSTEERPPMGVEEPHLPPPNDAVQPFEFEVPNSETSDFHISNYIRCKRGLDQEFAYLHPIGQWVRWDRRFSSALGWGVDDGAAYVSQKIQFELERYAYKFGKGAAEGEGWNADKINSVISQTRLHRVRENLKMHLIRTKAPMIHNIQTPQGTIDLRTGQFLDLAVRKQQFDIRYTGVGIGDASVATPKFDSLLYGLAGQNREVVDWIWHYLGYALLGEPKHDCFLVIWGPGKNGKSTLLNVLQGILRDYFVPLNSKVLLDTGANLHPTSLNRLRGKRLAVVSEMPNNAKWNEEVLKQISGRDDIAARNMNKDETTFQSEAALLVVLNKVPKFSEVNEAILRRFRIVQTTWRPAKMNPRLEDEIRVEESANVFAKMVAYACKVFHHGLPEVPPAMLAARDETLQENDPFFAWAQAECDYGPAAVDDFEFLDDLMTRYKQWLSRNKPGSEIVGDAMSDKEFRKSLERLGVSTRDGKGNILRKTTRTGTEVVNRNIGTGIKLKIKMAA